jgi:hypothetical protein
VAPRLMFDAVNVDDVRSQTTHIMHLDLVLLWCTSEVCRGRVARNVEPHLILAQRRDARLIVSWLHQYQERGQLRPIVRR